MFSRRPSYEDVVCRFFVSKMSGPKKDESDVQNGPLLQVSAKDVIDNPGVKNWVEVLPKRDFFRCCIRLKTCFFVFW